MTDIQLINNDTQVRFEKKLWHPTELVLAQCYGFHIDIETGVITANVFETWKQAMYEFIRISFKNFSESISEENRRNKFYERLEVAYQNYENHAMALINEKLPYAEKLYAHQKEGIMFSLMHRCNFLAFEMRLGKSGTSASLSRILNIKRTVIICPAIAKWGWFRDLTSQLWGFNELYFTMLDSAKSKSFKALQERFVIINYDILEKFFSHLTSDDVGHIILDESHRIKNRFSDRSKTIQKLVEMYPNAKITFLSGTPVANRFNDLFNYFKISGHPMGESYKKFTDEYTIKTAARGGEKVTGAKNIQDLKIKMMNFMLSKKMDDCFDMPEDVVSRYTFDFDDYRDEYNKVIDEMAKEKNMAALRGHIHSINIITCKAKMKGIIQIIEDIVEESGKVVVFGSYTEPFKLLVEHFGERCLKVDGSTNAYDRDRFKREFWDNPDKQVFLGNYLAAGEALDLSVASDVVHINFPFTPRELRQAQFRCKHPEKKGQHLRIHYTFAKDSIDEHIYNILLSKEKDINSLMDGKEVMEMEKIEEILIKQLLNRNELPTDDTVSLPGEVKNVEIQHIQEEKLIGNGGVQNEMPVFELPDRRCDDALSRSIQETGHRVVVRGSTESQKDNEQKHTEAIGGKPEGTLEKKSEFELMAEAVNRMEGNGSQFIPSEPKVVTNEQVAKNFEYIEKNNSQLAPPPTFL